jgi:hypothetical protein
VRVALLAALAACGSSGSTAHPDAAHDGTSDGRMIDAPADGAITAGPWEVVVGGTGACALHSGGGVKCWGGLWSYEVPGFHGDMPGEMGSALPLVNLGTGRTAKALSAGGDHVCALLDDDHIKCWGTNNFGQLGLGDTRDRGLASGDMGDGLPEINVGTGRTVREVSAGEDETCVVLDTGAVKCWGLNGGGELGYGDQTTRGSAAGQMGDSLPAVDLGTGRTAKHVYVGESRACAILDDDSLKCWGNAASGALGQGALTNIGTAAGQMGDALRPIDLGTGLHAVSVVHAGDSVCAVLSGGGFKCWGRNTEGELALGDTTNRGDTTGEMGDALPRPDLGGTMTVLAGEAGGPCAVLGDGTVACWGSNYSGSLGLGVPNNTSIGDMPSEVGAGMPRVSLAGAAATMSAHGLNACATLTDGHIQCWGANSLGQLGLGDTRDRGNAATDMGTNLPFVDLGP